VTHISHQAPSSNRKTKLTGAYGAPDNFKNKNVAQSGTPSIYCKTAQSRFRHLFEAILLLNLANPAMSLGLAGRLYRYRTSPSCLQAFESPTDHSFKNFVVYLGGLTDGLLACPYVEQLAAECEDKGWAFVQPIISSSYLGYGVGSLRRDTDELSCLLSHLVAERGCANVALIGHSTGCQNTVHFLANAPPAHRALVRAAALQAPVSDREAASLDEVQAAQTAALLEKARAFVADGRGGEVVEMQYGFCPLSAERCLSLMAKGGADDMFSSDFTDSELAGLLQHMSTKGQRAHDFAIAAESVVAADAASLGAAAASSVTATTTSLSSADVPCGEEEEARDEKPSRRQPHHPGLHTLVAFSMADEYVSKQADRRLLVRRLVAAMQAKEVGPDFNGKQTSVMGLEIKGANHNLSAPPEAAGVFVAAVGELLSRAMSCP
jgi:pimeloyl-ACP methyl ester carboxylesterase